MAASVCTQGIDPTSKRGHLGTRELNNSKRDISQKGGHAETPAAARFVPDRSLRRASGELRGTGVAVPGFGCTSIGFERKAMAFTHLGEAGGPVCGPVVAYCEFGPDSKFDAAPGSPSSSARTSDSRNRR
ncbi:hypothetical protein GCM10028833_15650 [Glycomyces tarimensis]